VIKDRSLHASEWYAARLSDRSTRKTRQRMTARPLRAAVLLSIWVVAPPLARAEVPA